jgi:hypothetical protein
MSEETGVTHTIIEEIPQYDPRLLCVACGDKTKIVEGFGVFGGGGVGPYTLCDNCGHIITKSHEEKEGTNVTEDHNSPGSGSE